jgi:hypothetical protein
LNGFFSTGKIVFLDILATLLVDWSSPCLF